MFNFPDIFTDWGNNHKSTLRLGQYFVNNHVMFPFSRLYHEEDTAVAKAMILDLVYPKKAICNSPVGDWFLPKTHENVLLCVNYKDRRVFFRGWLDEDKEWRVMDQSGDYIKLSDYMINDIKEHDIIFWVYELYIPCFE